MQEPHTLFELDPDALEFKTMLNNEGGLGEVWIGELTEISGTHKVAVKKYPSAFAEEEVQMFRRGVSACWLLEIMRVMTIRDAELRDVGCAHKVSIQK